MNWSNLMFNLEYLLEIILCKWPILFLILTNLLLFLLNLILDRELVLATFYLWCYHEYIIKRHNHRIVIVQTLGLLQFLSKQECILLDHLIDHVLNHS